MVSANKLTVIIAFRNEGDEVEKTVQSILETTKRGSVPIILMDDASDDGVDYKAIAEKYGCRYRRMPNPLGPAIARTIGARWCTTEQFVFMDGHMRLYDRNWNERVIKTLDENPRAILCAGTLNIAVKTGDRWQSGACFKNEAPSGIFEALWAKDMSEFRGDIMEIPCVLGAFYAFKKSFWQEIKGLSGLCGYGYEEPFMSLKTWYLGGKCLMLRDFYVGHLYRETPPTPINSERYYANQMMLLDVFTLDSEERNKRVEAYRAQFGADMLEKMDAAYAGQANNVGILKKYIAEHKDEANIARLWELNAERHP